MSIYLRKILWIYPLLLALVTVLPYNAKAAELSIGAISRFPAKDIQITQPLADYLASALEAKGISKVSVKVAKDIPSMIQMINQGLVHLYIDSPMVAWWVHSKVGGQISLRRWKKGIRQYQSLIFVRKDSPIKTLTDLKGLRIAFEEPYSTTGRIMPSFMIMDTGLKMTHLQGLRSAAPKDKVAYLFSGEDLNTLVWVLNKKVDAGAVDDVGLKAMAGSRIHELRILARSPMLPRNVVLFSRSLDAGLKKQIEKILVNMHLSEKGKKALKVFKKTVRFDRLPKDRLKFLNAYKDQFHLIYQ